MATSSSQGQSTGFVGKVDWADYMKYRPEYPEEFYERIYKQVKLSGGSYDAVNGITPLILHEVLIANHEHIRLRSRWWRGIPSPRQKVQQSRRLGAQQGFSSLGQGSSHAYVPRREIRVFAGRR